MTLNEWINLIEEGSDILFDVAGHELVIFTWLDDGIGIGERGGREPLERFADAKSLVDGYLVAGTPLKELVNQIIIREYS